MTKAMLSLFVCCLFAYLQARFYFPLKKATKHDINEWGKCLGLGCFGNNKTFSKRGSQTCFCTSQNYKSLAKIPLGLRSASHGNVCQLKKTSSYVLHRVDVSPGV